MKWSCQPKPRGGDRRERVVFLLFPHRCTDNHWRWLERVVARQFFGRMSGWWITEEYQPLEEA